MQKLILMKQWYDVHDKEMLAIVEVLEQWRAYLQEIKHQTIIKLNHKNLQYFMTTKKLKMNSEKIKAVIEFLTSECIKNIQTFQELAEYYWRFITDFISITASFINLLQKDKSFKWTESQKWVFQEIKEKFKKKSILIYFDYEKSVIIDADALEKAMRAWLQQIDNEKWKWLIACYAQKLTFTKQ